MNIMKFRLVLAALLFATMSVLVSSCKSKKIAPKAEEVVVAAPVEEKAPEPVKEADTDGDGIVDSKDNCPEEKGTAANGGCPEEIKKAIDYKNIQFEFNSSVLKTSSYAVLDVIAAGMKNFPDTKFQLDGHSSAEGTEARNLALSIDRANAVKNYLVNNGIKASNLITKGNGEKFPVASNDNEEGRALNRRVEIKPL